MSKKLNIIEAMKMPIGTEFEVFSPLNRKADVNMILRENENNKKYLEWVDNEPLKVFKFLMDTTFIPIQQPVSFMEAIANEYNRVRVDLTGLNFYSKAKENLNKYMSVKEMFKALYMHFSDYGISQAIKEGKWYIEESEADSND